MKKSQLKQLIKEVLVEVLEGTPAIQIDGKCVDESSIELDGVDRRDYPDFSDAFVAKAEFEDGTPLTDEQCIKLSQEHGDLVNNLAHEHFL